MFSPGGKTLRENQAEISRGEDSGLDVQLSGTASDSMYKALGSGQLTF